MQLAETNINKSPFNIFMNCYGKKLYKKYLIIIIKVTTFMNISKINKKNKSNYN